MPMAYNDQQKPMRKRQARLTVTDKAIIKRIGFYGFQTYPELRSTVLQAKSRAHTWVILKRLVRFKLLLEHRGDNFGILGWTLTPKAKQYQFLEDINIVAPIKAKPLYRTSFRHDLILREVQSIVCKSSIVSDWKTERYIRAEKFSENPYLAKSQNREMLCVPDAIFYVETDKNEWTFALELELTLKSHARLRKKFEKQLTSPDYHVVLYVVANEELIEKLENALDETEEKSLKVRVARNKNKIFFSTLENLRQHKLDARFNRDDTHLSFNKLQKRDED
ncbi:MAG: hypothetical protein AB7F43_12545 [Bacteriovoracia bacterium]